MDQILVLADGMVRAFGERNEVLARLTRPVETPRPAAPRPAAAGQISAKAS
jgi:ABC-type protease/lipase transport system fused ATPase/permease subunit